MTFWTTRFGGLTLAAVAALGLTLPASAAMQEWSYFSASPPTHPYSETLIKHFDAIEERSNGELVIELVYFGETPTTARRPKS